MKYVSIDLETTGLDVYADDILEIGAVIDDLKSPINELPRYRAVVGTSRYKGHPYALHLNAKLFKEIVDGSPDVKLPRDAIWGFVNFLKDNGIDTSKIHAAGKNFANFDKPFLKNFYDQNRHAIGPEPCIMNFHHRSLDPGSMYLDPVIDKWIPGMEECMRRAGIEGEVAHTAVEDALIVIKLIRFKLL